RRRALPREGAAGSLRIDPRRRLRARRVLAVLGGLRLAARGARPASVASMEAGDRPGPRPRGAGRTVRPGRPLAAGQDLVAGLPPADVSRRRYRIRPIRPGRPDDRLLFADRGAATRALLDAVGQPRGANPRTASGPRPRDLFAAADGDQPPKALRSRPPRWTR